MATWLTANSATLNGDGGWTGYTARSVIDTSAISNTGYAYTRLTFRSGNGGGVTVDKVYIGERVAAGDLYDFASTPTELKFSGASGFNISSSTSIISDSTLFTLAASKSYVISLYVSSGSLRQGINTGWAAYYLLGNDASTVNTSGYSGLGDYSVGVLLIEVSNGDTFVPFTVIY